MLFINISSDQIYMADGDQELFLERNEIEHTLGPTLIEWYKKSPFEAVFLLNGPGGFTNLRVGTLTLNLLNKLLMQESDSLLKREKSGGQRDFIETRNPPPKGTPSFLKGGQKGFAIYSITKIDLFKKLYDMGILSSHGMIYIGQTKNIRYYDFKNMSYEKIGLDKVEEYSNIFLDVVKGDFWPKKEKMINMTMKKEGLLIQYKGKKALLTPQELRLQAQSQVKPEYMIEAIE